VKKPLILKDFAIGVNVKCPRRDVEKNSKSETSR